MLSPTHTRPWFSLGSNTHTHTTEERKGVIEAYMNEVLKRKLLRGHPFVQSFLGFSLRKGVGVGVGMGVSGGEKEVVVGEEGK